MKIVIIIMTLFILSCGSDGDSSGPGSSSDQAMDFDEFVSSVSTTLEDEAINCGVVDIDSESAEVNTCVADQFLNNNSFVAFYEIMGIDSQVGRAISGDSSGVISFWTFDSLREDDAVQRNQCMGPEFTGSVDGGYDQVFRCENSSEIDISDEVVAVDFDEFVELVSASIDGEAIDCGVIRLDENSVEANTCVAEAFMQGNPFLAAFELQGFDSQVGIALSRASDERVFIWNFDSNVAGGVPAGGSKVTRVQCEDPEFSGSVDGSPNELFLCSNMSEQQ